MMRALFLDRDGIINEDLGYVHKIDDLKITAGIIELCQLFTKCDFKIFIVTNQSGIARGYFHLSDFELFQQRIEQIFANNGVKIWETKYCPHHPNGIVEGLSFECSCRKPKPGMILTLIEKYQIDTNVSWMFGDKTSDMECAKAALVKNRVLISQSAVDSSDAYTHSFPTILAAKECLQNVINNQ